MILGLVFYIIISLGDLPQFEILWISCILRSIHFCVCKEVEHKKIKIDFR